jgi:hypothetical protein
MAKQISNSDEMQFSVIPKRQFQEVQDKLDKMSSDIQEMKKTLLPNNTDELLTKKETARLLKVSDSSVWLWTKKRILKSYQIQGRIYYKRNEILEVLIEL